MKIDKMLFGGGCCVSNTDTDFESGEVKLSKSSSFAPAANSHTMPFPLAW